MCLSVCLSVCYKARVRVVCVCVCLSVCLLQGETDVECRMNSLRLVQSMLCDDNIAASQPLIHEAKEAVRSTL